MISQKNKTWLIFALIIVNILSTKVMAGDFDLRGVNIQYLAHTHLDISDNGINRLHFANSRILKIVGDSNQYGAILSDNGSDLFFTSKLPIGEIINLSLLLVGGEVVDVRLHVKKMEAPAIINVNLPTLKSKELQTKEEIKEMISKMALRLKGKYFVEPKERTIVLANRPDLILTKYVSYRYGDLMGVGFNYSSNNKNKSGNKNVIEHLSPEELKGVFKEILAISVDPGSLKTRKQGRVFVVFKYEEGIDV